MTAANGREIARFSPRMAPNLAGRYSANEEIVADKKTGIKKADFKPGLVFRKGNTHYAIMAKGEEWLLLAGTGAVVGTIVQDNSYKGFNLQTEVMGQKVTAFFLFRELQPVDNQ
ncbi:hypothetical protein [Parapedobacter soli]|uniref:hypothetical protein n=1 Tax=Parapedobacter soli TaxID=416955 RepID=UPI0021C5A97B|nr:hypothetical protein [Parapedobacter soli]